MSKLTFGILVCVASFSTAAYAQCGTVIKKADPKLKIIRSGDLIGDGALEYVAAHVLPQQPKKGMHVLRLVIARVEHNRCSIVFDAGKSGPKNPFGYVGIEYIDDGSDFYGYAIEFSSNTQHKGDLDITWLNPEHEPEGEGIAIGWNRKVGRYQEYRVEDDGSPEIFKPELRNPPHHNSKLCGKCPKYLWR
jgi:hypothetical protein